MVRIFFRVYKLPFTVWIGDADIESAMGYAAEVCKLFNPTSIVMFGSYVKGTATPESDIDVAIIFDGYTGNWLEDSALLWGLTMKINTRIEPIILDRAQDPSGFVEEVYRTGEVLFTASH